MRYLGLPLFWESGAAQYALLLSTGICGALRRDGHPGQRCARFTWRKSVVSRWLGWPVSWWRGPHGWMAARGCRWPSCWSALPKRRPGKYRPLAVVLVSALAFGMNNLRHEPGIGQCHRGAGCYSLGDSGVAALVRACAEAAQDGVLQFIPCTRRLSRCPRLLPMKHQGFVFGRRLR